MHACTGCHCYIVRRIRIYNRMRKLNDSLHFHFTENKIRVREYVDIWFLRERGKNVYLFIYAHSSFICEVLMIVYAYVSYYSDELADVIRLKAAYF